MLKLDVCRCLGRTGYKSDDRICPRRTSCARHMDIPENTERLVMAEHLCAPGRDAFIPMREVSLCVTSPMQPILPQNSSCETH